MKIAVTGASGLIGTAFVKQAQAQHHEVVRLVRRNSAPKPDEVPWDPANKKLDAAQLEGIDAIVNLAGENIAGRWTDEKKNSILDSRISGTRLLVEAMSRMRRRPAVFVCASATGFYGTDRDDALTEDSEPGDGFLADVCRQWEAVAAEARDLNVRVVSTRFGMVLSAAGGALKKMTPPFRLGLGAALGNGRQYTPWVAIDDAVAAIAFAIDNGRLSGPLNVVAPQLVTNREFTSALAGALGRPAFLAIPAPVLRLVFGHMAREVLLTNLKIVPQKLTSAGFRFRWPELQPALHHVLSAR